MNLIAEIWDGKLPLVKVYWLYGVAVGAFFTILSLLIKDYPIVLIVIAIALIPYQILVFVGIWRSADAYRDKKIWAVLAKVHVVLGVIAALNGVASLTKTSSTENSHNVTKEQNVKLATLSTTKWHTLSNGDVIKWKNNKECYVDWSDKVSLIDAPLSNSVERELTQEEELVAIVYFPLVVNDAEIKAVLDKEAYLKIRYMCHKE
jgi:hypothetical protein